MQVYAQGEAELASEKQKGEQTLDAVEQVIDVAVDKIDIKLGNNTQKKQQLEDKQNEIHKYLEEVSQEIGQENNSEDIKEKVETAKKVVVLKVVSGVTEYEDVEESIDSEVADTPAKLEDAMESIQDSMETESGDYSIIVRSTKTQSEVQKLFATFDTETRIEEMYESDGKNYFEVFLAEDSIFKQEMLEDIELGILPENFLGVEIILPEVFGINELNLDGENISQTWGIEKYQSYKYTESSKSDSEKITVAVVDTGIDYKHPDLQNNVNQSLGKDFVNDDDDAWDDQGHGTHVAGTIAANINSEGIIGVNPHVELIPLKICTSRGFCPSYAVLRALDYAKTQKIDILNMSLGGRGNPDGHAICGAIASVVDAGGIVVAASGNSNIDTSRFVPGGCVKAITVAAVDSSGMRAQFSNYGDKVDVAAPGVQVYSTYPTNKGNYRKLSGTSMATPHVVGIVSLMQARDSDISSTEVKAAFKKYTSSVSTDKSYKTIAQGVDLEKLMGSYEVAEVTIEKEEQIEVAENKAEEIVNEKAENTLVNDATIDPNIQWMSDVDKQKLREERLNEMGELEDTEITPASIKIDIGDKEDIQINSETQITYKQDELLLEEVTEIISEGQETASFIYDENGQDITGQVEINSDEESIPVAGIDVAEDFDFENLPEIESSQSDTEVILDDEEFEEQEIENQEVFVDGAEAGVEINSAESATELLFQTGALNIKNSVFVDEAGQEIDIANLELVDEVETIVYEEHTDEFLVDGAESGVEINSASGEEEVGEELTVKEFNPEADSEIIEGEVLEGYDDKQSEGVEINSLGDEDEDLGNNEELTEILEDDMIIEEITDFEYIPEEISIDGAESGVEINSLGGDEPKVEELKIPEYDGEETELGVVDGPEIFGYNGDEDENSEGVEINSLKWDEEFSEEEGEIKEMLEDEMIIEEIEEVEFSGEDIFLDGAESGVEINSLGGEEEQGELIEVSEYDPHEIPDEIVISEETIETPAELLDNEDFSSVEEGEEEILSLEELEAQGPQEFEEFDEDSESEEESDGMDMGIQNVYFCEKDIPGSYCRFYIYGARNYDFKVSNGKDVVIFPGKRDLYIKQNDSGNSSVKMYYKGRHYHTIYMYVKPQPKPKEYNRIVEEGKNIRLYFPERVSRKIKSSNIDASARANVYSYRTYVSITGYDPGRIKYYIYGENGGVKYIVNLTVKAKPAIKIPITVLEGQRAISRLEDTRYYKFSFSNSKTANFSSYGNSIYVTGKKAGKVNIYAKRNGVHRYTIEVTVTPLPKPKEYFATVVEGKYINANLPKGGDLGMSQTRTGSAYVSAWDYRKYSGYVKLRGGTAGNVKLYFRDRKTSVVKYILNVKIIPKPPVIKEVTLYEGQNKSNYLSGARYHDLSFSRSGYAKVSKSSNYVYVAGLKAGSFNIYAKRNGIHRYTLKVTVKPKPKPKVYNVNVQEGKETRVTLPKNERFKFYGNGIPTGKAWFYSYAKSGYIKIKGRVAGKVSYDIRDSEGIHLYTIHANVIQVPPTKEKLELYNSKNTSISAHGYLNPSVSKRGIVYIRRYKNTIYLEALKAGTVDVYLKNSEGRHLYTYTVTIKPIPQPKIFTSAVISGGSTTVHLPDTLSNYNIRTSGDSIFDSTLRYTKSFHLRTRTTGIQKIHLYSKKTGFEVYRIEVTSRPEIQNISLYLTDEIYAWYHPNYSYKIQNTSLIQLGSAGKRGYIIGKKVGKTQIKIYKDGGLRKIWNVTVKPYPTRKTVTCTTTAGESCTIRVPNDGYYSYSQIPRDQLEFDKSSKEIEIESQVSGTATIYVRSAIGNYITHIFKVRFNPRPVSKKTCMIPQGKKCSTYTIKDIHNYTLKTSRLGIVSARGSRIWYDNIRTDKGELIIEGLKQGYTEVYLYRGHDHVATIATTIMKSVPDLKVAQESFSLRVGESTDKIAISGGGGRYSEEEVDDGIYLNTTSKTDTTGYFVVKGLKEGRYYARVQERWGDSVRIKVKVEAKELELSEDELDLRIGESKIVSTKFINGKLESFSSLNDKISIQRVSDTSFKITGLKAGTSYAGATDSKGEYDSVLVTVKGTYQGEKEDEVTQGTEGKIRYIRDWANGSNKNNNSHWVEIQAFDEKGTNIARGKTVTPKNRDYAHRPMSRVTDGNLTYGNYAEGGGGLNYVTVDLGSQYDIQKINIKKYFKDNRTYKETKTEVSSDGKNWTTLYDSAVSGTYAEPSDGSGIDFHLKSSGETETDTSVDTDGVRFIRDHLNGSNKNTGSHWVEIQALDANGTNIAKGKQVSGKTTERSSSAPYSRITDGVINYNYWTQGKSSTNWVQVDLGAIYDIEKVKVWHYFKDDRTYNATKTEVSVDGKNWTTLYDSAVSGTYVEPKDGSGREYAVNGSSSDSNSNSEELSELEKLLQELFAEFGIESVDSEEGVKINSEKTIESIIDSFVQRLNSREDKNVIIPILLKRTFDLRKNYFDKYGTKSVKSQNKKIVFDYLDNSLVGVSLDTFCSEYRKGKLVNPVYENKCGTLIQSKIINLSGIEVKTRKQWGAKYSQEDYVPDGEYKIDHTIYNNFFRFPEKKFSEVLDTIVIHHSAGNQNESINNLEQKMKKDGYHSIAYHFIIDGNGNIYEGRPLEQNGDHVESKNTGKIGIVVMGDFEYRWQNGWRADHPTESQIKSLQNLSKALVERFVIKSENITGHQDHKGTECPGDNLEDQIEYLKKQSEGSIQSESCSVNTLNKFLK
ncbi:S8 family serine peptidase [Candidatus Gracilibacteria bacterium]|nr:S8 family serine peptidase [Candidatus Gracilibacteria bacterium]